MDSIFYPTAAAVAWATLIFQLVHGRILTRPSRYSLVRRSFLFALAGLCGATTFGTPAIYAAFDKAVGQPNLARLFQHIGILIFSVSIEAMLAFWARNTKAQRLIKFRIIALGAVVIAMTILFLSASVDVETSKFTIIYGDNPYIVVYLALYLIWFGSTLWHIVSITWRYRTADRVLRIGLRITAVGACLGLGYCFEKALYILTRSFHINFISPSFQETISPALSGTGAIALFIGLSIPPINGIY
ncbi:MAG: hypothetical protein H0T78_02050, partial [Longispora sp.]|nr:hypothetical protein [Longispora sp. (in: high G+C Gram-positive bacteria)]